VACTPQGHGGISLMERQSRPAKQPPGAFTDEAVAALRGASPADPDPILLGFHPAFTTNPYQSLLYGRVREAGIAPVGIRRAETIAELTDLQRAGLDTVLHLHWLHLVLRDTRSVGAAERDIAAFLGLVDAHREAGGRLAWTVHNILPHEAREEATEARLATEVVRRADVIHVMAAGTPEHVAPYFELPKDRLLHVPHPSYAGAYQDHVSTWEARHRLGLAPDDLVFLVFGAIRAYKGLEELLDAWAQLPPNGRRRLVLAGAPSEDAGVADLLTRAAVATDILVDARKIPAEEVQVFLRAADVAVLPYRRALNSGALMLALTFGLPVLVPAGGGLAEIVDGSFAVTFDPDTDGSLAGALIEAERLAAPAAREAAVVAAAPFDPAVLSRRFAQGLRERLRPAS
jgi:beta-1,4-mannosyltransferase